MISSKGLSKLLLISSFIWLTSSVLAQSTRNCEYIRPHQADHWVFGLHGGIDFSTPEAQAVVTTGGYDVSAGVSSYSDADGTFRFFSNGMEVYNSGYYQIASGAGLMGNAWATMNSIFVPNPGNSKQIFVFTLDMYLPFWSNQGVNYSIIDFSNNNGGNIISKNNLLFTENTQKVCAVQHENGRDYWVVFHGFGSVNGDSFYTYLVDTGGVNTTPILSKVGYIHSDTDPNNGFGYMKASPDGNKIALVIPASGVIELLDFNKSTGMLSNPIDNTAGTIEYPKGVEFSPDNSKLYVCTTPNGTGTNYLYQFDLSQSNPFTQPFTIIDQFDYIKDSPQDSLMSALQLSPDGKIFLTKYRVKPQGGFDGLPTLSVIYNPDRPGAECNYNSLDGQPNRPFDLQGGFSLQGLPNFVTDYLNIPHFSFFHKCHHDTTVFEIRNTANLVPTWNFSTIDPNGTLDASSDPKSPGYVFSEPGDYSVELTESWNGMDYNFVREVTIHPLPSVDIGKGGDTISILPNSSVRLDAGTYDYYYWTPGGSNNQYLDVTQEGWYEVLVTDTNCCSNTDRVYVQFADLHFPNAFKPASTLGINQTFGVIGDVSSLANYSLHIFDRWGKIIFETDNPLEKWTGQFEGGVDAPAGVYVWHSVFTTFESGLEPSRNIDNRGTVMLVR